MARGHTTRKTSAIRTPEVLGETLKAMFDSVAEAPLPDDILQLVDELEAGRDETRRPREHRAIR